MQKSKSGFTIVELLIVIVVIAILATISIVAYNGIQQRAKNTKTITAANQIVKSITGYIAANGAYPATGGVYCLVPSENSACTAGNTTNRAYDTTLTNNLNTISTQPSSVPDAHSTNAGIVYLYNASQAYNGASIAISYSLQGNTQQCGVANVMANGDSGWESSTTGWTYSGGGTTRCYVTISGP